MAEDRRDSLTKRTDEPRIRGQKANGENEMSATAGVANAHSHENVLSFRALRRFFLILAGPLAGSLALTAWVGAAIPELRIPLLVVLPAVALLASLQSYRTGQA